MVVTSGWLIMRNFLLFVGSIALLVFSAFWALSLAVFTYDVIDPNYQPLADGASSINYIISFLYGGFLSIVPASIGVFLIRKVRFDRRSEANPEESSNEFPPMPTNDELAALVSRLNQAFDVAHLRVDTEFSHKDEDKHLFSGQNGGWRKVKFTLKTKVSRPLAAMSVQERELLRIAELLNLIPDQRSTPALADIRAALIWADGKADIASISYEFNQAWGNNNGLRDEDSIVTWAMKRRGLSWIKARNELITISAYLENTYSEENPVVAEAKRRLIGGQMWAEEAELEPELTSSPGQHSILLGPLHKGASSIGYIGEGAVLSVAAPGSGKTQAQVIPNLLNWAGPAIVLDVKGELYDATASWRAENVGPVHRFAPFDPDNSATYNPLSLIRDDDQYIWEDARFLASMMAPVPENSREPFWAQSAQDLITAAIAAACYTIPPEDREMVRVLNTLYGVDWDDFIASLSVSPVRAMSRQANELLESQDQKTLATIRKTAQTAMAAWAGQRIEKITSGSDWHPLDLRKAPYPTIYITAKPGEIEAYASMLRVVLGQHIRSLTSQLPPSDAAPVLLMLDELPRLRYMQPIEEALEVGRQYGLRMFMIAQSLGQLQQSYKNAKGMIGSCALRIFMNPSAHDGTADQISKELGEFESPLNGSKQPIATPQQLSGQDYRDNQIVLRSGGKPVRLAKAFAYQDPVLRKKMGLKAD